MDSRLAKSRTCAAGSTCGLPNVYTRCGVLGKRHRRAIFTAGHCLHHQQRHVGCLFSHLCNQAEPHATSQSLDTSVPDS